MKNVNVLQVHMLLHKKIKKEMLIPKEHYHSVTTQVIKSRKNFRSWVLI